MAAAAVVLSLIVCSCTSSSAGCQVGQAAPGFSTTALNGSAVRLADFAGRPVLVNFWASWCEPCRHEFPVLKELAAAHADLQILGVVFQDSAGNASSFLREQQATWPGLIDPKAQIASGYCVAQKPGIPVSVLIDGKGVVRARHLGLITSVAEGERLLAQA